MYTNNMYLFLIGLIGFLYYGIFKIDYKNEKLRLWKILILTLSMNGLLTSVASIMSLEDTLFYKIISYGGLCIMFVLFSVICWKVRKNPKARAYCYLCFGSMIFILLLIIVIFFLSRFGFFG